MKQKILVIDESEDIHKIIKAILPDGKRGEREKGEIGLVYFPKMFGRDGKR
jgi:hypothetical protein